MSRPTIAVLTELELLRAVAREAQEHIDCLPVPSEDAPDLWRALEDLAAFDAGRASRDPATTEAIEAIVAAAQRVEIRKKP